MTAGLVSPSQALSSRSSAVTNQRRPARSRIIQW